MMRAFSFVPAALVSAPLLAQVGHQVRAVSFEYIPDTVFMLAGDTILFRPVGGHDMTEVDSLDWTLLLPFWNGGFATPVGIDTDFVVTAPGTHYFLCAPHSFTGMRGVLIVDDGATDLHAPAQKGGSTLSLAPNPAHGRSRFEAGEVVRRVELIDANGHAVRHWEPSIGATSQELSLDGLAPGPYRVRATFPDGRVRQTNLVVD